MRHGHQPRRRCPFQHPTREHDHGDARDGDQRTGGPGHLDGQELRDEVQVLAHRGGHRREKIDQAGHEERSGGNAADAADPDAGRRPPRAPAARMRRPASWPPVRGANRPPRPAFDDGVVGQQPLAQGGQREIDLGLLEANVQIHARLDLDDGGLTMMEVRRRSPKRPRCSCTISDEAPGLAKNPDIEVRRFGHECPAHDDARRPGSNGVAGHVEDVFPSMRQELVRGGPGALRAPPARRPGGREPSPPRARQMPHDVRATTTAKTANSATPIDDGDEKRENHDAS